MTTHEVTTRESWLRARIALMAEERALMRRHDELAAARRALPWVHIEQPYVFDGPEGRRTLAELFDGRSQLAVYHFMFGPDAEQGCKSCSFWADHFDAMLPHLAARDVTLAVVSRAPRERLVAFQQRMGWQFPWYSAYGSTFNADFAVSFTPEQMASGARVYNFATNVPENAEKQGLSVFVKDGDELFHTYSAYARGVEPINATYQLLDLVPKGRDEAGLPWPMAWVRHRDAYGR